MDKHQPPGCTIGTGNKNCLDEAVTASKRDSWELQLINDKLQVGPRQGQVVFRSSLGRGPSWLEESSTDSNDPDKISRTHDIEAPAVNPVPPDETRKTAMDPDAMIRTPTTYKENQQSTAG